MAALMKRQNQTSLICANGKPYFAFSISFSGKKNTKPQDLWVSECPNKEKIYGAIPPPKFYLCFRCSVHILCLLSAIRYLNFAVWHRACNIRVSQFAECDMEVWQYDVSFPFDIPITHFQFHAYHRTCSVVILYLFHFLTPAWMGDWMINRCNTALYFSGLNLIWRGGVSRNLRHPKLRPQIPQNSQT